MNEDETPQIGPVKVAATRPQEYWYDPKRGKAWEYDGTYGGDQKFIRLVDIDEVLPILGVLPRLWATGHKTVEQDGLWHLFDKDGEGIATGTTFRGLCVNILLMGI